jgi:tetratricopeptide (TPR) repeat protein
MYLKQKKPELAETILLDLYSQDTINGFIARNIGLCGYKQGDSRKAIKWFFRAIELDSTDIKAYRFLFTVYATIIICSFFYHKEKFDLAIEIMDKAIKIDPQNIELYISVGDLHVIRNHHFKAVDAYLKAFEIDKTNDVVPGKLGLSYYKIKKYEEAKYYLLIADEISMDLNVYKYLGYIYKKFSKPDSSIMFFNKALDILRLLDCIKEH